MASKDDNDSPVIYGVSHLDGRTPVRIHFRPNSRKMLVDSTTSIAFDPLINASQTDNDFPVARATSSADDSTVRPWVVNESTGAVLIAK